ncbi:Ubiquitin-like domain [Dillenia turbinata]|uniref:Ubiquitin-like domain n=1 Tax=Dillenia turbinata TaxID=194707 RepID=A0AAN8UKV0_9MAGN
MRPFTVEVGFFDTVLEIKEKVQKYRGIPISRQTLIFNNMVLQDEQDVGSCELLQDSKVQIIISQEPEKSNLLRLEEAPPIKRIELLFHMEHSSIPMSLEVDVSDTIGKLKERIQSIESIPVNRLVLSFLGNELNNRSTIHECGLHHQSHIEVSIRASPPAAASTASGSNAGSKKLKLLVLPRCGTKKIPVEVNASDNVGELRKQLPILQEKLRFSLPSDGYFFIHKQSVMDDERSFRWHHVNQGDTIEIFNGWVTRGS